MRRATFATEAHVQFETIHPFLEGNGRLGRLLITLMLMDGGLLLRPLLYLSLFFKQHRAEYYRLLDAVRSEGDWKAWIEFFLRGVEETATGALQTAQRLMERFDGDEAIVRREGRAASSALSVLAAMRERPIVSLKAACQTSGLSFPAATAGMQVLQKIGLAREITGQRRSRVFAYTRYVAILGEGTEPL